ncbi:hypothetical protein ACWEN6_13965 [Sphaerisporangium sp. NPDC004334]
MTAKLSISVPDTVYQQAQDWADAHNSTVSAYFTRLAQERADADRRARERLARKIEQDKAADPEGYSLMEQELRQRINAARRKTAAA